MKKIPTLFKRNYDSKPHLVYDEVTLGCEWVRDGEGIATVKLDGTCCLIQDGVFYKRYELKSGKRPPVGFIPAQDPDPITGEIPGWIPVGEGPEDKYHREAFSPDLRNGTYELMGPKINRNPSRFQIHVLIAHHSPATILIDQPPVSFDGLNAWLFDNIIEGIVWHHYGRMAKIKRRDFGWAWPPFDFSLK